MELMLTRPMLGLAQILNKRDPNAAKRCLAVTPNLLVATDGQVLASIHHSEPSVPDFSILGLLDAADVGLLDKALGQEGKDATCRLEIDKARIEAGLRSVRLEFRNYREIDYFDLSILDYALFTEEPKTSFRWCHVHMFVPVLDKFVSFAKKVRLTETFWTYRHDWQTGGLFVAGYTEDRCPVRAILMPGNHSAYGLGGDRETTE